MEVIHRSAMPWLCEFRNRSGLEQSLIDVQFTRWAVLEAISLLIEFIIFGIAVAMIWMLQMPREKKLNAILVFAVRIPYVHLAPKHPS